jgi:hypothetical protein
MALPWVRLDSNIAGHDKILALLGDRSPKRWQAAASYVFALGWSGGQGTDGYIPAAALAHVHGTPSTARLLTAYGLWDNAINGYQIHNWDRRQQLSATNELVRQAQRLGALKGNCIRRHGPDCGCWREGRQDTG